MNEGLLAVDVGNSAIKLCVELPSKPEPQDGLTDGGQRTRDPSSMPRLLAHSVRLDQRDWDSLVIDWVQQQVSCKDIQWRIATVHPDAGERLCQAILAATPTASVVCVTRHDVPMRLRIDHPDRLGIDRLLAAHAARRLFGTPLVVVDAGSAVTVDWVDHHGDFCGGAILPGLGLQASVLAEQIDALPRVDFIPTRLGHWLGPAKNTADAIRLGIVTGLAAAVDRLAIEFSRLAGVREALADVVLTGGDAALIAPLLTVPHRLTENLVCRGLLDLPRS